MDARSWLNLSLFNTTRAGEYFEYLVQGIDPLWSLTDYRAKVVDVREETPDIRTFVLRPTARWAGFDAGQHVQLTLSIDGSLQTRTLSISSTPYEWQERGVIALTVKRVPGGRITGWMHDHLKTGAVVSLSPAQGDFKLPPEPEGPVVYFAAGSGITPIASQLGKLAACKMPVAATLFYFARSEQDFAFGAELKALSMMQKRFTLHCIAGDGGRPGQEYSQPQGTVSRSHAEAALARDPEWIYVCGPHPFRAKVKELLLEQGFPRHKIREEAFGLPPASAQPGESVTVSFSQSRTCSTTNQPDTLLAMAEAAGLAPTSGCRMGICYTCKRTKSSGQVRNVITGELSGNGEEDIRLCVSSPVSDVVIDL